MATIKNKISAINKQINSISRILNELSEYDEILQIDIDLLRNKILKVYEDVININASDNDEIATVTKANQESDKTEYIEPENKSAIEKNIVDNDAVELEKTDNYDVKRKEPEEAGNKNKENEPETNKMPDVENSISIDKDKNNSIKPDNKQIILINNFINELNKADDLASQLKLSPIDDISSAISINDRIAFVNNLFEGDNDNFTKCLEQINSQSNLKDAINTLSSKISFDIENTTHTKFIELIYRRFAKK